VQRVYISIFTNSTIVYDSTCNDHDVDRISIKLKKNRKIREKYNKIRKRNKHKIVKIMKSKSKQNKTSFKQN